MRSLFAMLIYITHKNGGKYRTTCTSIKNRLCNRFPNRAMPYQPNAERGFVNPF
jgi:hypothetical protein